MGKGDERMRFMVMHKVDAGMERGEPPAREIIEGMGKLVGESLAKGVFEYGAGLHPSAERVRLTFERGERRVEPGPFAGRNELVDACFLVRTTSMEQALEHAGRFASVLGDVELEVGLVIEPWDIGLAPKPTEQKTKRFLLLKKGDARSERGAADARTAADLAELEARLRAEGVLLASERLAPSARGARRAARCGRQADLGGRAVRRVEGAHRGFFGAARARPDRSGRVGRALQRRARPRERGRRARACLNARACRATRQRARSDTRAPSNVAGSRVALDM
jgi:hypothetical protein